MKNNFFSQLAHYTACLFKYLLYLFNLSLLVGLGIKTVNLWISTPFDFSDTLSAFPEEPEFINKELAEKQFWGALTFETFVFVIGGFLCYELLIKQKTFRRGLTAPLVIAFLWATGESAFLFLPATEKAQTINVCRSINISWDTKNHKCRLMDLELKRFEKLKALKKNTLTSVKKKASVKKATPARKPSSAATTKKKAVVPLKKKTTQTTQTAQKKPDISEKKIPSSTKKKTDSVKNQAQKSQQTGTTSKPPKTKK